jgi:hypothetical protein
MDRARIGGGFHLRRRSEIDFRHITPLESPETGSRDSLRAYLIPSVQFKAANCCRALPAIHTDSSGVISPANFARFTVPWSGSAAYCPYA